MEGRKIRHAGAAGKLLALLLAAAMITGMTACARSDKDIRFGTAAMGGNYYAFGQAFAQILEDADESFDIDVKQTAGSAANTRLMSEGYIQLAIAQMDVIDEAVGENGLSGFKAVAGIYTETCQIVVRSDAGISSVRDLRGRKVNLGEEESGSEKNALQILQVYGLSADLVQPTHLNYTDAAAAMEDGEIDAMFVTAGVQTTVLENLASSADVTFLSIDAEELTLLTDSYEFFTDTVIPAGTYTGQNEDVSTVGVKAVLIVSDRLSDDTVEQITAALFDHQAELQHVVSVKMDLSPETALDGVALELHPGALKYYQERGITTGDGENEGGERI